MTDKKITTPICDFVQGYAASGISRFHMPGHKGLPESGLKGDNLFAGHNSGTAASDFDPGIFLYDITEIHGADSLYEASGIIKESEENTSRLFGTACTLYSTEGSSQCIRAMLALVTRMCLKEQTASVNIQGQQADGNTRDQSTAMEKTASRPLILAARNVHRSFITAAALLDLDVAWLYPEDRDYSLCSCKVSPARVRETLSQMQTLPAAVYITSPDYLGNLQDIKGIAEAAHEFGIPLLVDNAHGAYLHFLNEPVHPMDLGADICCDSAHKTLPVLTGGAYLHIGRDTVFHFNAPKPDGSAPDTIAHSESRTALIDNAKRAMSIFGSTSPSYLILESLDNANRLLAEGFDESIRSCAAKVQELKADLEKAGWKLIGSEPLKITIHASACGYSGQELADILRKAGVECEYSDPDYLVLMTSPCNTETDFENLAQAFETVRVISDGSAQAAASDGSAPPAASEEYFPTAMQHAKRDSVAINFDMSGNIGKSLRLSPGTPAMSIREAMFSPSELLTVEEAAGRICCDTGLSCPPAIPPVICGEIITPEAVRILKYYGITHIRVVASGR